MTNCREYGKAPYRAIVVHGGPGAPGSCAGICRELSEEFGVLEHLQGASTISGLIEEMLGVIADYNLENVTLVGHSWGAWLSFIFASMHPQYVNKLILVGSGLFDAQYYPQLLEARSVKVMPSAQKEDIQSANLYYSGMEYNPDNYCLLPRLPKDMLGFNEPQFHSLMNEIIPLRESGELLGYSENIGCPVVAIHGRNDPHPFEGIKLPLEARLPDFRMYVLEKCGHEPWNEYFARDMFFEILKNELRA